MSDNPDALQRDAVVAALRNSYRWLMHGEQNGPMVSAPQLKAAADMLAALAQQAATPTGDLADRLRAASQGYPEWRVQHPVERCYCISFNRDDSINPEREAREWLERFKRDHPAHKHASYEVACVQVQTRADRLMIEAADAIATLSAQAAAPPATPAAPKEQA